MFLTALGDRETDIFSGGGCKKSQQRTASFLWVTVKNGVPQKRAKADTSYTCTRRRSRRQREEERQAGCMCVPSEIAAPTAAAAV